MKSKIHEFRSKIKNGEMHKTFKPILILVMVTMMGATAIGQEKKLTAAQKERMETQLVTYFEKLDLSEEQKPKFEEITKRYGKQMLGLKESDKGRLAKYNEFKSIRKNKNKEMKLLLSKEQYQIYEEVQDEMQRKVKEERNNKS